MGLVTQAELGKRMGLSRQRISQLVRDGVVEVVEKVGRKHLVDLDAAMKAIEKYRDPSRRPQAEAAKKRGRSESEEGASIFDERHRPEKSLADLSDDERAAYYERLKVEREEVERLKESAAKEGLELEIDTHGMSLNEIRAFKELYLGRLAQLNYEKEKGELVPAEEVRRQADDAARTVKSALVSIPDRVAPRLVGAESEFEIRTVLEQEILSALDGLSGGWDA